VCSADDLATNEKVAIKKISNVFDSPLDARRTLREIKLLRELSHDNIVTLRDVFPPPDAQGFADIYMVYDVSTNESRVLKTKLSPAILL